MITKQQFKSQMSRLEVFIMRDLSKAELKEMYGPFQEKDFGVFEEAISKIIEEHDGSNRFPTSDEILIYYDNLLSKKEAPDLEDLKKAAKTLEAKGYLDLIYKLLGGGIDIENQMIQKCLGQQRGKQTYDGYDPGRRCFTKHSRQGDIVTFNFVRDNLGLCFMDEVVPGGSHRKGRPPGVIIEEFQAECGKEKK